MQRIGRSDQNPIPTRELIYIYIYINTKICKNKIQAMVSNLLHQGTPRAPKSASTPSTPKNPNLGQGGYGDEQSGAREDEASESTKRTRDKARHQGPRAPTRPARRRARAAAAAAKMEALRRVLEPSPPGAFSRDTTAKWSSPAPARAPTGEVGTRRAESTLSCIAADRRRAKRLVWE